MKSFMDKFKPGGGNKMQPYVPAGNGKEAANTQMAKGERKMKLKQNALIIVLLKIRRCITTLRILSSLAKF